MLKLKEVNLIDFAYPCIEYVKRRLDIKLDYASLLKISGENYTQNTNLDVGDVLVWESSSNPYAMTDANISIEEHGVVTKKVMSGRHYGVYEGNGLVSDTTFNRDDFFPSIRMMHLSEHYTPKHVLRIKSLVENKENEYSV